MATTKSKPLKLGDFLREQQEPFILEVYLSEKGYIKNSLVSEANCGCCHGNSTKSLQKSSGLNKSSKGLANFSNVLRAVSKKLLLVNRRSRAKNFDYEDGKPSVNEMRSDMQMQEVAELDSFSSPSSATVYYSCPESDTEEASITAENTQSVELCNQGEKTGTDTKTQWRRVDDSTQHSPASMLEKPPSSRGSPLHNREQISSIRKGSCLVQKTISEDSILSATLSNLLHSELTELQEPVWCNPSPQYFISKRVLQQTKQLLFDCLRELVETRKCQDEGQQQTKELLGSEELGKLMCEEIKAWGKPSGDEWNIRHLLESDLVNSAQEWKSAFESEKKDIGLEIEDAILEDMLYEFVTDNNALLV